MRPSAPAPATVAGLRSCLRSPLAAVCLLLLCLIPLPAAAAPESLVLPALVASLAGNFQGPTDLPPLTWSFSMEGTPPRALAKASGKGISLEVELSLARSFDAVQWRIRRGELDLAELQPFLLSQVPDMRGYSVSGKVVITGEGGYASSDLSGWALVNLAEGRVDNLEKKLSVEGIECSLKIVDLATLRSAKAQVLRSRGGKFDVIEIGAAKIVFSGAGTSVSVEEASISVLGGKLLLAPFTFSTEQPSISMLAQAEDLQLSLLIPLLPPFLAEASGKLSGFIALRRDAKGIAVEKGFLGLAEGTHGIVRMLPSPGLISAQLPPKVLNQFPGFKRLETGEAILRAERFDIAITPAGDEKGRSGVVRIEGGPLDPGLRAPVKLEMNINGPLESLINFTSNSSLRFAQ